VSPSTCRADEDFHHATRLDLATIERTSPARALEFLVDTSPELSRAMHDYHTMTNPGWTINCYNPGTRKINKSAQKVFDEEILGTVVRNYGTPDVLFDRVFTAVGLRGGVATETVLADDSVTFLDLALPDPAYFTWRRVREGGRGKVWHTGQYQNNLWVDLDLYPTFKYVPFHPLTGKPRGRSLFTPAVYICVFLMSILHDLKRVIQQQGYPRLDITIDFDKLRAEMPRNTKNNSAELKKWAQEMVDSVKRVYAQLRPDDTYIHSAAVTVNKPNGVLNNMSLGALDTLFGALERMATRAVKSMSILMGSRSGGGGEGQANREWEIYAKSMKSVQHVGEAVLENGFNVAMRARGIRCRVEVRFAELRAAEELRDAQTAAINAAVAGVQYDRGWISQDDAAKRGANVDKADQAKPRQAEQPGLGGEGQGLGGGQVDPGETRSATEMRLRTYVDSLVRDALRPEALQPPPPAPAEQPPLDGGQA
jgi:hypothetical protein